MTQLKELTVFVSETGRRYIDAADIAVICGIGAYELDRHYRPAAWGTPRDFKWDGRRMWFAEASMEQLADSLDAAGKHDAAILLRAWLVKHTVAVAETSAADAGLVAPLNRPASSNWAKQWEDEHQ